jgi:hypothetical protein
MGISETMGHMTTSNTTISLTPAGIEVSQAGENIINSFRAAQMFVPGNDVKFWYKVQLKFQINLKSNSGI